MNWLGGFLGFTGGNRSKVFVRGDDDNDNIGYNGDNNNYDGDHIMQDDDDDHNEGTYRQFEQQQQQQQQQQLGKHTRDTDDNVISDETQVKRKKAMKLLQTNNVTMKQSDKNYFNVTKVAAKSQIPEKEVREIRTALMNNDNKTYNPGPSVAHTSTRAYVEWEQENHNEAVRILVNNRFKKQRDEGYLSADKIASMCQIKLDAVENYKKQLIANDFTEFQPMEPVIGRPVRSTS